MHRSFPGSRSDGPDREAARGLALLERQLASPDASTRVKTIAHRPARSACLCQERISAPRIGGAEDPPIAARTSSSQSEENETVASPRFEGVVSRRDRNADSFVQTRNGNDR